MAKRALLVGCNYPGTESELKGCVNDVAAMRTILTNHFGFDEADIVVLVDTDENAEQPTHANILSKLHGLISGAGPGDILVFHFSGHGSRIPAEAGDEDNTGYDEAIVPTDSNPLTDDDFRDLVKQIPEGVKFTFISDSCHSGGLIDETKEQIGDAEDKYEQEQSSVSEGAAKEMSAEVLALRLSERSGHSVEVGNIRTTLFDIFGEDASLTVKMFEKLVLLQINEEEDDSELAGKVSALAVEFLQSKITDDPDTYLAPIRSVGSYRTRSQRTAVEAEDVGILLSGCQSHELSSDQNPTGDPADAYGAFSKAIETVLNQSETPLTNREMILEVRKWLQSQGLRQNPCLYCNDENADAVFICD